MASKKSVITLLAMSLLTIVAFILLASPIFSKPDELKEQSTESSMKKSVVVTIFPLYDFTRNIAEGRVELTLLTPVGIEAHSYEPKPSDLVPIRKADLFIYNSANFERYVTNLLETIKSSKMEVLDSSQSVSLIQSENEHGEEEFDPHFWLDPLNAIKQVLSIKVALVENDPANEEFYEANAIEYVKKIKDLDSKINSELSKCRQREFLVFHRAFTYFAQRYNLTQLAVLGLSPEAEPTPKDVAKIVESARSMNIQVVYTEPTIDPRLAETIAKEITGQVLTLNPIENVSKEDFAHEKTYISIMEENLTSLLKGMGCG